MEHDLIAYPPPKKSGKAGKKGGKDGKGKEKESAKEAPELDVFELEELEVGSAPYVLGLFGMCLLGFVCVLFCLCIGCLLTYSVC